MKKLSIIGAAFCLALTLSGCKNSNYYNEILKETYIHKYDVPMAKADWEEQGQNGKIVQLKKDGVTVTQSFENGELHGETSYTFPNTSTIHRTEVFEKGKLKSKRENYPNGSAMWEVFFNDEAEPIKLCQWYEDGGTPALIEIFEQKRLVNGEYRTPLNDIEARVNNGQGIRVRRSNEGELLYKDHIENGEMVKRTIYFANGDPSIIIPYKNGQIHGTRLTYLPGGVPNSAEAWVDGKQEGITVTYQNGEKYAEISYVNGKKNGIEKRYRDGTTLVEEVTWVNDVQHGKRELYVDGETKVQWYHQGELVSRPTFERLNLPH